MARTYKKRGSMIRRALAIIDLMAPLRHFHSLEYLTQLLNDRTGETWVSRTVQRDLEAFVEYGLCEQQSSKRDGHKCYVYRLKLIRTNRHQELAITLEEVK